MEQDELILLLRKYKEGRLSEEEWNVLWDWLDQGNADEFHLALNTIGYDNTDTLPDLDIFAARLERKLDEIDQPFVKKYRWRFWSAAAASLLLLCSVFFLWRGKHMNTLPLAVVLTDNKPGINKTVLRLPGGKEVILDDTASLTNLGIRKDSSQLSYLPTQGNTAPSYHTLVTPKGGQCSLVLSDGTRVWLNAASSLYYPTSFSSKGREVMLTGEAYFEVSPLPSQPFSVRVNDMRVIVLGTSFNISAYPEDNKFQATLVNGAVKVYSPSANIALAPGERASLPSGSTTFKVERVDTDIVTAWTKGLFHFDNADIKTITTEIARWYDIEVEFRGEMPVRRFGGVLSRKAPLAAMLKVLEDADVKCEMKGRRLLVSSSHK